MKRWFLCVCVCVCVLIEDCWDSLIPDWFPASSAIQTYVHAEEEAGDKRVILYLPTYCNI